MRIVKKKKGVEDILSGEWWYLLLVVIIVCIENPVLCTGSQKETLALSCLLCFTGGSLLLDKCQ